VVGIMSYTNAPQSESQRTVSGWTGWVVFAATILFVSGLFSIIQGLVAIIGPNTYFVASEGDLFLLDVAGWGWYTLVLGVLIALTGWALFSGATWARVVAVILAILSMVGQLLLVPVQPWWSFILISIDFFILYSVIAHGRELREER